MPGRSGKIFLRWIRELSTKMTYNFGEEDSIVSYETEEQMISYICIADRRDREDRYLFVSVAFNPWTLTLACV